MTSKGGEIPVPFQLLPVVKAKVKYFYLKSKALIGYTGLLGGVGVSGQVAYRAFGPVLYIFSIQNRGLQYASAVSEGSGNHVTLLSAAKLPEPVMVSIITNGLKRTIKE